MRGLGGIISRTLEQDQLIIYVRFRVENYPAIFCRSKNYPASVSMAAPKLSRHFLQHTEIIPNYPAERVSEEMSSRS